MTDNTVNHSPKPSYLSMLTRSVTVTCGALLFACSSTIAAESGPELEKNIPANTATATTAEKGKKTPESDPFSPASIQYDFAIGLFTRGMYEEAADELQKFLDDFPKDPRRGEVLLHLGQSQFYLSQFDKSEESFTAFIQAAPNHEKKHEARLRIGCSRYERKDFDGTVKALQPVVKAGVSEKMTQTANYYLGRSYQELGKMELAAPSLEAALNAPAPLRPLATFALGEVKAAQGDFATGEKYFRQFIANWPKHKLTQSANLRLAETLRNQDKLAEAAKTYTALSGDNGASAISRQALLGLGWVQVAQTKFAAAEASARAALAYKDPALESNLTYLLGVALLKQKKFDDAAATLGNVKEGDHRQDAMLQRTWALLSGGKLDEAETLARKYIKTAPKGDTGTAAYLLGSALFRKADYPGAADAYSTARENKTTPYREEAAFQLALSLERQGKDREAAQAYAYFAENFADSKNLPAALLGLGNAQIRLKQWQAADNTFNFVLESKKSSTAENEQALLQKAVCLYELKKYDDMESCYQTILSDYPHSSAAPEALYWVAWGAQRRKNYGEAIKLYRQFIDKYPKHDLVRRCHYRLGMALFQDGDESAAAAVFYDILLNRPEIEIGQTEMLWLGSYFMQHERPAEAEVVYGSLLKRHPGPDILAMTLYYRAEAQRRQAEKSGKKEDWQKAMESFRRLQSEKEARFQSLSNFGLGQALRHLGQFKEAEEALKKVKFAPDDPMMGNLYLELGLLNKSLDRKDKALRNLIKVGLLYDDMEICGKALLEAGILAESMGKTRKARSCYQELISDRPNTYGARYGEDSPYSREASLRLKNMENRLQQEAEAAKPQKVPPKNIAADEQGDVF